MFDDTLQLPAPDWALNGQSRRALTTRSARRRAIRISLDAPHYAAIEQVAAEVNASVEQVAALWLRDRIDSSLSASGIARLMEAMATMRSTGVQAPAGPGRERRGLHDEIVSVLKQRGQPMTASEIAAAIRERNSYRAPRSGRPITGASVSRRVANPYYRSLFERQGRQVALAEGDSD